MKKDLSYKKMLKSEAIQFINIGVACNCLVLLKEMRLLDFMLNGNSIDHTMLIDPEFCPNYTAAYAALVTLEKTKLIERSFGRFCLTDLGYALSEYIGLINILFDGYGQLMASQKKIAKNQIKKSSRLIRFDSILKSSIHFGQHTIDPLAIKLLEHLKVKGTLCDLACGLGTRLTWLCKMSKNPGLGFESNSKAVETAKKKFQKEKNLSFEKAEHVRLEGVWEDVTVAMQYCVFHNFIKQRECAPILNSYLDNFPNLKYFIYVDIVAPSHTKNQMMPGYDYIHGLLGITTPTYEDMMHLFEQSKYAILEEIPIPDLPNTFVWLLCPKHMKNSSYRKAIRPENKN